MINIMMVMESNLFTEPYCNRATVITRMAMMMDTYNKAKTMEEIQKILHDAMGLLAKAILEGGGDTCITKDCPNKRGEVEFLGTLCMPCARFVMSGDPQGQAWKNAVNLIYRRIDSA